MSVYFQPVPDLKTVSPGAQHNINALRSYTKNKKKIIKIIHLKRVKTRIIVGDFMVILIIYFFYFVSYAICALGTSPRLHGGLDPALLSATLIAIISIRLINCRYTHIVAPYIVYIYM